jgi:hypothetical protein
VAARAGFYLWPAEREELALAAARVGPKPDETTAERAQALAVYAPRGGAGGDVRRDAPCGRVREA